MDRFLENSWSQRYHEEKQYQILLNLEKSQEQIKTHLNNKKKLINDKIDTAKDNRRGKRVREAIINSGFELSENDEVFDPIP